MEEGVALLSVKQLEAIRIVNRTKDKFVSSKGKRLIFFNLKVIMVTSFLSLLGSSFIVLTYLAFKELRKGANKIIFNISLCDTLFSVGFLLCFFLPYESVGPFKTIPVCVVQGFILQTAGLGSNLWVIFAFLISLEKFSFKLYSS